MRSFSFNIPLKDVSLRPEKRAGRLDTTFAVAENVLAEEWGLSGFGGLQQVKHAVEGVLPQVISPGVLLYHDRIEDTNADPVAKIPIENTHAGRWEIARYGPVAFATNGEYAIVYRIDTRVIQVEDGAFNYDALCYHNGRTVFAGVKSLWPEVWRDKTRLVQLPPSAVVWSSPGARNLPLLLHQDITKEVAEEERQRIVRENTAGWVNWEVLGDIKKLIPFGHYHIIVYGSQGIGQMTVDDQGYRFTRLLDFGVKNTDMVAGDLHTHIFQDATDNLWVLGRAPQTPRPQQEHPAHRQEGFDRFTRVPIERLGYAELFEDFNPSHIVKDTIREIFYITDTDNDKTIIVSSFGVTTGTFRLTDIDNHQGIYKELPEGLFRLYVELNPIDMGLTQQKTVTNIKVGGSNIEGLNVSISATLGDKSHTKTVALNNEGTAHIFLAGNQFAIAISGSVMREDLQKIELDYITIVVQATDKRSIHSEGFRVNQTAS